jgi:hypothetical protein
MRSNRKLVIATLVVVFASVAQAKKNTSESSDKILAYLGDSSRKTWEVVDKTMPDEPKTRLLPEVLKSCLSTDSLVPNTQRVFSCRSKNKLIESCALIAIFKDEDAGTESSCSLEFDRVKADRKIIKKTLTVSMAG